MILYVALDDNNGMMFHNRRQFEPPLPENIVIDEVFLDKAEERDCCFVENLSLLPYEDKVTKLVIYKWNRVYPGDFSFDIDLSKSGWKMVSVTEFAGSSHEKITKEVWENGEKNAR